MAGYVMGDVVWREPDRLAAYSPLLRASLEAHQGEVVLVSRQPEVVEGTWNGTAVLLRFPTLEAARRWYGSTEYAEALRIRLDAADSDLVMFEA